MGILTDTLWAGCNFGPSNGLSSDVEVAVSLLGMCVQPMNDRIPLIVSL